MCLAFPLGEGRGEEGGRNGESEWERVRGREGGGREGGKEFDYYRKKGLTVCVYNV